MFNLTNSQVKTNQNHIEIHFIPGRRLCNKMLVRVWKGAPTLLVEVLISKSIMENTMVIPKKTKNRPSVSCSHSTVVYI